MSIPESLKFDTRVRDRFLRNKLLNEDTVAQFIEKLADVGENAITLDLQQPALEPIGARVPVVRTSIVAPRPVPALVRPIAVNAAAPPLEGAKLPIELVDEDEVDEVKVDEVKVDEVKVDEVKVDEVKVDDPVSLGEDGA